MSFTYCMFCAAGCSATVCSGAVFSAAGCGAAGRSAEGCSAAGVRVKISKMKVVAQASVKVIDPRKVSRKDSQV